MPDDIVSFGGPERGSRRKPEEELESLFHSRYARLVRAAFSLVSDRELAEQLAQRAYLRLWRRLRWRLSSDPDAAAGYLEDAIARLSRQAVRRRLIELRARRTAGQRPPDRAVAAARSKQIGTSQGRRLSDAGPAGVTPEADGQVIDTDLAWLSFLALRSRSAAIRRRGLVAVAGVTAAAIAVPVLAGHGPGGHAQQPGLSSGPPPPPHDYPRAVVSRIPLSGVIAVVGSADRAWAIRAISQPGTIEQQGAATTYQLVGMSLQKRASIFDADQDFGPGATVLYRVNLGSKPRAIAAGAGRVWLTTTFGQAKGQIARVDPATGQVRSTLHLAAGRCDALAFSSGHLFAACTIRYPGQTEFWRINPVSQRAYRLTGPVHGYISSVVAAPQALWYVLDDKRIRGLANVGGRPREVTSNDSGYQDVSPGTTGLAYDAGSIWALGPSENLVRIDPVTGRVVRYFTYRNYDPARVGGLNFLTAGGGWLWFLDNGYPFSGVLRVSEATGRPAGGVSIAPNSCGAQSCSQIYFTPGSIWVPTAELLIQIDPTILPGGSDPFALGAALPPMIILKSLRLGSG